VTGRLLTPNPDEAAPLEEEGASETASPKARAVRCSGVFLQHGAREGDQGFPPGAIVLTDNDSISRSQVETDSKDGQCSSRLRRTNISKSEGRRIRLI